jgi:YHS domain-containing protein
MSKSIFALSCAILLGLGVAGGYAVRAADPAPAAPATQPAVDPKPVNSKCLVTGEDIDPAMTLVYDGKTYGFCCADCMKAFNKNPQKYLSNAK